MSERTRDDSGRFVETVTPERVLQILRDRDDPVATASDIADELGCTPQAVNTKLAILHDQGRVARRTVGSRAVVWWSSEEQEISMEGQHDPTDPFLTGEPIEAGEPIAVADTDKILGDALSEE
ncbi:MAG: HTH domain-containing protein [Natrialbaceae archaeon]|nr:HTH domain-containing protein [Natrialbaceae archaeon]